MILFEMKKIFSKSISKMALLVLTGALVIVSILTINNVEYIAYDQGQKQVYTGAAAARKIRDAQNQWAGLLTEDMLKKVIRENSTVNSSPEALSDDYEEQDKAYARKQGFSTLTELISSTFSEFNDYDYYRADRVSQEEVTGLYQQRIASLKQWLE